MKIKDIESIPPGSLVIIRVSDVEKFLSETNGLHEIMAENDSIAIVLHESVQLDLVSDQELEKLGLKRISH